MKHTDGTSWYQAGVLCAPWTIATSAVTVLKILTDGKAKTSPPDWFVEPVTRVANVVGDGATCAPGVTWVIGSPLGGPAPWSHDEDELGVAPDGRATGVPGEPVPLRELAPKTKENEGVVDIPRPAQHHEQGSPGDVEYQQSCAESVVAFQVARRVIHLDSEMARALTHPPARWYEICMALKGVASSPDFRSIPADSRPAAGGVESEAPTTPSEPKGWFSSNVGAAGQVAMGAVRKAAWDFSSHLSEALQRGAGIGGYVDHELTAAEKSIANTMSWVKAGALTSVDQAKQLIGKAVQSVGVADVSKMETRLLAEVDGAAKELAYGGKLLRLGAAFSKMVPGLNVAGAGMAIYNQKQVEADPRSTDLEKELAGYTATLSSLAAGASVGMAVTSPAPPVAVLAGIASTAVGALATGADLLLMGSQLLRR